MPTDEQIQRWLGDASCLEETLAFRAGEASRENEIADLKHECDELKFKVEYLNELAHHLAGYLPGTVSTSDVGLCRSCGKYLNSGSRHYCPDCLRQAVRGLNEEWNASEVRMQILRLTQALRWYCDQENGECARQTLSEI